MRLDTNDLRLAGLDTSNTSFDVRLDTNDLRLAGLDTSNATFQIRVNALNATNTSDDARLDTNDLWHVGMDLTNAIVATNVSVTRSLVDAAAVTNAEQAATQAALTGATNAYVRTNETRNLGFSGRLGIGTNSGASLSASLVVLGDGATIGPNRSAQVDGDGDLYVDGELEVSNTVYTLGATWIQLAESANTLAAYIADALIAPSNAAQAAAADVLTVSNWSKAYSQARAADWSTNTASGEVEMGHFGVVDLNDITFDDGTYMYQSPTNTLRIHSNRIDGLMAGTGTWNQVTREYTYAAPTNGRSVWMESPTNFALEELSVQMFAGAYTTYWELAWNSTETSKAYVAIASNIVGDSDGSLVTSFAQTLFTNRTFFRLLCDSNVGWSVDGEMKGAMRGRVR